MLKQASGVREQSWAQGHKERQLLAKPEIHATELDAPKERCSETKKIQGSNPKTRPLPAACRCFLGIGTFVDPTLHVVSRVVDITCITWWMTQSGKGAELLFWRPASKSTEGCHRRDGSLRHPKLRSASPNFCSEAPPAQSFRWQVSEGRAVTQRGMEKRLVLPVSQRERAYSTFLGLCISTVMHGLQARNCGMLMGYRKMSEGPGPGLPGAGAWASRRKTQGKPAARPAKGATQQSGMQLDAACSPFHIFPNLAIIARYSRLPVE